ncbi:MAG: citramalate synthase [bacterium]|nr:citramalate synthase [bacterium]
MDNVLIYDTTLRDGAQTEGISFSVKEKIKIAQMLDHLGVHYIEGGWPGANQKETEFFQKIKDYPLKKAKIVAFGSTRRAKHKVENDPSFLEILKAETQVVCIFGKSWDLHVHEALNISEDENLKLIQNSVAYLKSKGKEVIYDAEHFFDGYKANPEYALKTIVTAQNAGADTIVLCDTNGGLIPCNLEEPIKEALKIIKVSLGIHSHNDSAMAVANSIMAVQLGCRHVQGTINGYGERCGNADLCAVIPNLKLKMGIDCISDEQLKGLTEVSRFIAEMANLIPQPHKPYVGSSAFAHKAGVHVSGVQKNPKTYEHIQPELVGNERKILISELAGQSSILEKAKELKVDLAKDTPQMKKILAKVKEKEHEGYQFEAADASFELLIKKALGEYKPVFKLKKFEVIVENRNGELFSDAIIKIEINGQEKYIVAEGDGPVNALDTALRKALEDSYPILKKVHLTDYKVRVLDAKEGTAAKVRVLIESTDGKDSWGTVGVSENIIDASWQALVDSVEYIIGPIGHI